MSSRSQLIFFYNFLRETNVAEISSLKLANILDLGINDKEIPPPWVWMAFTNYK